MKTTTLFSALALASAVVALPQAPKPPSYAQQDTDNTDVDPTSRTQQRPQPYQKQQNGVPHFQGDHQTDEDQVDAVPGNRGSGSGSSSRRPRPQSYGQNNNMNVDSNGRPSEMENQDEFSPQQNNRRPQDSTNTRPGQNRNGMMPQEGEDQFSPQQNSRQRPGQGGRNRPSSTDDMMPEDDEKNEDEDQPEDEEKDQPDEESEDQFSPQQNANNRRPGQSGTRPGGIGAQQGNYPQNRPGSIGGIGPGGIGSPFGSSGQNNFGPGSSPSQIGGQCVSQQEANQFVRRFIGILNRQGSDIGDAEATAEQIIAEDYIEISSSINTLEDEGDNGDTNSIAAESKQDWIDGMLTAPPFNGIQTLKVLVFCDQVVWYWNFASVGSGQFPVKGFNLFTLRRGGTQGSFSTQGQFSGSGSGSIGGGIGSGAGVNGQLGGSSQIQGGANIQGQASGSGSGLFRPSGLSGPGPASQVPTGSSIQAIKLETEFDSLANALDTGFQCTDRDGNDIQTSGGQGGPMGGMANFQNNRPQDQGQNEENQDQSDEGNDSEFQDEDQLDQQDVGTDRFGDIPPQSSQGGRQGDGRTSRTTSQRQGSGNGRNFNEGTSSDNFDQSLDAGIDGQFDQSSRGQTGTRGRTGGNGRLTANLNANSLAGQANGGNLNEAGTTENGDFDTSLMSTGGGRRGQTREGPGPQGQAALDRLQREGSRSDGNNGDGSHDRGDS